MNAKWGDLISSLHKYFPVFHLGRELCRTQWSVRNSVVSFISSCASDWIFGNSVNLSSVRALFCAQYVQDMKGLRTAKRRPTDFQWVTASLVSNIFIGCAHRCSLVSAAHFLIRSPVYYLSKSHIYCTVLLQTSMSPTTLLETKKRCILCTPILIRQELLHRFTRTHRFGFQVTCCRQKALVRKELCRDTGNFRKHISSSGTGRRDLTCSRTSQIKLNTLA